MLGFSLKQKEIATKNQLLGKGKKNCTHASVPAVGVVHAFLFLPRVQVCLALQNKAILSSTVSFIHGSNNKIINTADKHFNYIQL